MKYYPGFSNFGLFDRNVFGENNADMLRTDICEKDGYYELNMEAPGFAKEDIQIQLKNGYLSVLATRNTNKEKKDEDGKIIRKERFSGSYTRSFYVGSALHQEDVKASLENGELKITIPTENPKAIEESNYIQIQ